MIYYYDYESANFLSYLSLSLVAAVMILVNISPVFIIIIITRVTPLDHSSVPAGGDQVQTVLTPRHVSHTSLVS